MALTAEQKAEMAAHLRGTNVAQEHITDEYKTNLELADRQQVEVPTSEGTTICYVFTAKNRVEKCPVFINVHGGGFVRPHQLRDEIFSAKVADAIQGIVVDVDYKLAPEYPYPTAVNECYDVCQWVFTQLESWNGDPKRVSMGGHSAGATLTAAVALKANETHAFRLCLQVLDYGAFEMFVDPAEKPEAESNMIPVERSRMFNVAYTGDNLEILKDPYCSPGAATNEMLRGLPDALVISAGKDNFRFEDERYAIRMAAAGVKVTVKRFLNSNHGFIIHCVDEWQSAQQLIIDAIRTASL